MSKKVEMIGREFGRLKVLEEDKSKRKKSWICECSCGEVTTVSSSNLLSEGTRSCGCLAIELNTTHGMSRTPTYRTWLGMIHRCNNPKHTFFKNYGARGITVCDKWLKFEGFFEDMGLRPRGLTLERKNNELGYFKGNCCFADRTTQARNRRLQKNNITGVTGVSLHKPTRKYMATICVSKKKKYLGLFISIHEAAKARKAGEQKYWGVI